MLAPAVQAGPVPGTTALLPDEVQPCLPKDGELYFPVTLFGLLGAECRKVPAPYIDPPGICSVAGGGINPGLPPTFEIGPKVSCIFGLVGEVEYIVKNLTTPPSRVSIDKPDFLR